MVMRIMDNFQMRRHSHKRLQGVELTVMPVPRKKAPARSSADEAPDESPLGDEALEATARPEGNHAHATCSPPHPSQRHELGKRHEQASGYLLAAERAVDDA